MTFLCIAYLDFEGKLIHIIYIYMYTILNVPFGSVLMGCQNHAVYFNPPVGGPLLPILIKME